MFIGLFCGNISIWILAEDIDIDGEATEVDSSEVEDFEETVGKTWNISFYFHDKRTIYVHSLC